MVRSDWGMNFSGALAAPREMDGAASKAATPVVNVRRRIMDSVLRVFLVQARRHHVSQVFNCAVSDRAAYLPTPLHRLIVPLPRPPDTAAAISASVPSTAVRRTCT